MSTVRRLAVAVTGAVLACIPACGASDPQAPPGNPAGVRISGVSDDVTYHGVEPAQPYQMPHVTLTADNGEPFDLIRDTAHPVTLIFFGYTHCRDECPLILNGLASTYRHLPPSVRKRTQVVFVTTDPRRDTGPVLRAYLRRFDPTFVGLTGRLHDILAAADAMGVAVSGMEPLAGGGYDVGHSIQVVGFRGDQAPVIWMPDTSVADMVSDIVALAG